MQSSKQLLNPRTAGLVFLFAAALIGGAIVTYGQEGAATGGITFPVAELGNCGSEKECRTYCDQPGNMDACIAFAKDHGLMNNDEIEKGKKFGKIIREGGGPGGCITPGECQQFCSTITNLEACLAFAEQNGFTDRFVEEGKKMRDYLKSGGTTPGSCTSKESCEAYCSDFDHAEECIGFAKRLGVKVEMEGEERSPEDMERVIGLMRRGETPGGCRSREQCESYCRDESHTEECIVFAEKAGFMKPGEAEQFRKLGGKGPGGCTGREQCETYCNEESHREECMKFAEEHGIVRPEEAKNIKDGLVRLRAGLENAPPEVRGCVNAAFGKEMIEEIQAGRRLPGPEMGEKMRGCFEKFGGKGDAREAFSRMPPEIEACLKEKLGDTLAKLTSGEVQPTPEFGDAMRACSMAMRLEGGPGGEGPGGGAQPQDFIRNAPPGVAQCLKEKLGENFEKFEQGGGEFGEAMRERVKACFESFVPPGTGMRGGGEMPRPGEIPPREGGQFPGNGGFPGSEGQMGMPVMPQQVKECLQQSLDTDSLQLLLRGDQPKAEIGEKVRACYGALQQQGGGNSSPAGGMPGGAFPQPPGSYQAQPQQPAAPLVCGNAEECARICTDPNGQFYGYPDCLRYRDERLRRIEGEIPPDINSLPQDSACPDATTCAARCANEASPYYQKEECIQYRLTNSLGYQPSGRQLFLSNVLQSVKGFFGELLLRR